MRHWLIAASIGVLIASPVLAEPRRPKPTPTPPVATPPADACAEARGSVRMEAYGYTHVVSLRNGCAQPIECVLWTDVDAESRTTVQAQPGERVEIISRRGSPAREVTAHKSCRYR